MTETISGRPPARTERPATAKKTLSGLMKQTPSAESTRGDHGK